MGTYNIPRLLWTAAFPISGTDAYETHALGVALAVP